MEQTSGDLEKRASYFWNLLHIVPGGSTIKAAIDIADRYKLGPREGKCPLKHYSKKMDLSLYIPVQFSTGLFLDSAKYVLYNQLIDYLKSF